MTTLRKAYEQQLINLKREVMDLANLSNDELLNAINYYLHYFNCDTMDTSERIKLAVRLKE